MGNVTSVAFLFIVVSGIILVLLIVRAQRGGGRLRFGKAELKIDFENSKHWVHPRRQPGQARAAAADYFLYVKGTQWRYPLQSTPVYIGRHPDCQIKLLDKSADTRQAVIYWDNGRYKINNLSRRTPTRVNNRPITTQNLGDGNTIQMGQTRLIFRRNLQQRNVQR